MLIYLIRHGESELNRQNIIQGSLDAELSQQGAGQSDSIGRYLAVRRVAQIYTSPAKRAHATAEIIRQTIDCPMTRDPGLLECRFGKMEGRNTETLARQNPDLLYLWKTNPLKLEIEGMEPFDAFYERVKKTFVSIVAQSKESDIAIVTHAGVIGAIACYALDANPGSITRLMTANASVTLLEKFHQTFALRCFNSTGHLDQH